ncbi:hypothetical protein HCA58_15980 [Micromonospora sp. HNM0581]|uniref:hypothetical protein n=1 Tax=Micromonospora sp. HNM0581 TaxID=2716341 RepID=UPI00146A965E|nr:hypothetical protein [Micromonospora sp. HNM0581]NLU79856.1 hypothetical protein [Micromonospora sp. HNM0581]
MTRRGRLYVDPDGVVSTGRNYGEHVHIYDGYLTETEDLRLRYADAWGDDEMGTAFSTRFLAGMDHLDGMVGGVRGRLAYTSEGLVQFGHAYQVADDDAADVSHRMAADFCGPTEPPPDQARTLLQPTRSLAVHVEPDDGTGPPPSDTLRRLEPTRSSLPLAAAPVGVPAEAAPSEAVSSELTTFQRSERALPSEPAIPATSTSLSFPAAYVNGGPVPSGQHLVAFNPTADGMVRIDGNLYDAVVPVAGTSVTQPDGQPVDPTGRLFFLVRDAPPVDPAAPGYRPLVLTYGADGNLVPPSVAG